MTIVKPFDECQLRWKFFDGTRQIDMMYVLHNIIQGDLLPLIGNVVVVDRFPDGNVNVPNNIEFIAAPWVSEPYVRYLSFESLFYMGYSLFQKQFGRAFDAQNYTEEEAFYLFQLTVFGEIVRWVP